MNAPGSRHELGMEPDNRRAPNARRKPPPERRLAGRIGAAGRMAVSSATIVHAAASLYLGLTSQELRGALARGYSLSDVAEWQALNLVGLKRAVLNALRRMRGANAPTTATVTKTVEVAAQGWSAWQARVEYMIATGDRHGRAVTAA